MKKVRTWQRDFRKQRRLVKPSVRMGRRAGQGRQKDDQVDPRGPLRRELVNA